jgi:hypothetical protein
MIEAVASLDRVTAAGLLAKAALAVGYASSDADVVVINIIDEARRRLGLSKDANDTESLEQIADYLDDESDKLIDRPNTESALFRLAQRGDLPSDLYEINIIPNVSDIYGKQFPLEKEIIETTIRAPSMEQHYGPLRKPNEPVMVSLFLRSFRTRWQLKDFTVIVVAERIGLALIVHQAWRVYPWKVNLSGVLTPVDWLRKFADYYGYEIDVGGKKGHFFLISDAPVPSTYTIQHSVKPGGREQRTIVTCLVQQEPETNKETSAFIIAINIQKYRDTLEQLGVRREDILERFVPAPRPTDYSKEQR